MANINTTQITDVLDHETMVANLIALIDGCSDDDWAEGTYWYARTHAAAVALAEEYGVTVECAAGVIAALSPRLAWRLNILYAYRLFETGDAPVLLGNKHKALRIRNGERPSDVLSGPKVRAFYACIVDPLAATVCIDRHAIDAALGFKGTDTSRKVLERKGGYELVVAAYVAVADHYGIAPAQAQAIAWVVGVAQPARHGSGQLERIETDAHHRAGCTTGRREGEHDTPVSPTRCVPRA